MINNFPTSFPSLNLDFINTRTLDPRITFTRNSVATRYNSSGVLEIIPNNQPRLDYDPLTLEPKGLLIEETRTNRIRNNTMVGAVAGTPGTLPTNWGVSVAGGLSSQVISVGSTKGINYVDVRIFGTTTNTNLALNAQFESTTVAAVGQTWSESAWVSLIGGTTTGLSYVYLTLTERNSSNTDVSYRVGSNLLSTIGDFSRRLHTATLADASTAFLAPQIWVGHTGIGAVIDFTLRIGMPQLEQGAFPTSVIPTSTGIVTRNSEVASVNNLAPWYNATEGTIFSEWTRGYTGNFLQYVGGAVLTNNTLPANLISSGTTNGAGTNTQIYNSIANGGVEQLDYQQVPASTTNKTAQAFKTNDSQYVVNGISKPTDTSCTIPSVSMMYIGADSRATAFINSWMRRVSFYPNRMPEAQLQALTR
jgi:hypothetical protein